MDKFIRVQQTKLIRPTELARKSEKSHLAREKNKAFHLGVRKAVGVHSTTIPLSSMDIDLSRPAFTK